MKKISLSTILLLFVINLSHAQWLPCGATSGPIYYNGGNVGIGTTSPQAALDVGGQLQLSSTSGATPPSDLTYGLFPYGGVGLGIFSGATNSNQGIGIWTNPGSTKTEVMRILSGGNVGIGTINPAYKLDVNGMGNFAGVNLTAQSKVATNIDIAYGLVGGNYIGQYFSSSNSLNFYNGVGGANILTLDQTNSNVYIPTGNVGIGTASPDEKLTVNGTVHATEVKITSSVPYPDYVFKSNYKMLKLKDLQEYIKENHHLPNVPTEAEVARNGLNVGQSETMLLKKVEELTLYLIKKDEQLEKQQKQLTAQQKISRSLQQQISKLQKNKK